MLNSNKMLECPRPSSKPGEPARGGVGRGGQVQVRAAQDVQEGGQGAGLLRAELPEPAHAGPGGARPQGGRRRRQEGLSRDSLTSGGRSQ
jgi:hypothetical protein